MSAMVAARFGFVEHHSLVMAAIIVILNSLLLPVVQHERDATPFALRTVDELDQLVNGRGSESWFAPRWEPVSQWLFGESFAAD